MNRATSLYLDLIRPLAAFAVLLSHVSFPNLSGGQLRFLASSGKPAVDVFFVLSGFVIAHVCATREPRAADYAISRAARIYSVAVPALVLTFFLDAVGSALSPAVYQGAVQPLSPGLLARSLLFLGEQWNAHRFPGCDGPYWSLGFEVWYYAAFGVFLYAPRRGRWLGALSVLAFIGPKVALMFPNWLMGVAAYRLCAQPRMSPPAGWLLFLAPLLTLPLFQAFPPSPLEQFAAVSLDPDRLRRTGDDYLISAVFAAHLIGFAAVAPRFAPWLERHARCIRWAAGGTFSLYLTHLPVMHFLAAVSPWPKTSALTLVLLVVVAPLACFAFAELSERRKALWRALLVRTLARWRFSKANAPGV